MLDFRSKTHDFRPRIVIIENNDTLRNGYDMILSSNKDIHVVKAYSSAKSAIKNLLRDRPDIVFMEVDLAGEDGIAVIRKLRTASDRAQIIVLTNNVVPQTIFSAFSAGTAGYLLKSSNHLELLNAVDEILNNGAPMSSQIAKLVIASYQRSTKSPLSLRETEILSSLATGKTYKLTANNLHIGMETVKSHVKNIYSKLQVSTKSEAIELAQSKSLI